MNEEIVYQLTNEDIQIVSNEELGRELSLDEIAIIKERIAENINWYDAISEAINEKIAE